MRRAPDQAERGVESLACVVSPLSAPGGRLCHSKDHPAVGHQLGKRMRCSASARYVNQHGAGLEWRHRAGEAGMRPASGHLAMSHSAMRSARAVDRPRRCAVQLTVVGNDTEVSSCGMAAELNDTEVSSCGIAAELKACRARLRHRGLPPRALLWFADNEHYVNPNLSVRIRHFETLNLPEVVRIASRVARTNGCRSNIPGYR